MLKEKFRLLDVILIILVVLSIITNCVLCVFVNRQQGDIAALVANYGGTNLESVHIKETKITGAERTSLLNKIVDSTENLMSKNLYISCPIIDNVSDSTETTYYKTYIYNKLGEAIVDDEYNQNIEIIMKDSQCVVFSDDTGYHGADSDLLKEMHSAALVAQGNDAVVYEVDMSAYGEDVKRYDIDVNGYNNIKKMFNKIDSELGQSMYNYYSTMFSSNEQFNSGLKEASMKFSYIYLADELTSAACYVYQGASPVTNVDNIYTVWAFDGYTEIYDWELQKDWYDFDYSVLLSDDEEVKTAAWDELNNLTIELNAGVVEMLDKVREDQGLNVVGTIEETTETETKEETAVDETVKAD